MANTDLVGSEADAIAKHQKTTSEYYDELAKQIDVANAEAELKTAQNTAIVLDYGPEGPKPRAARRRSRHATRTTRATTQRDMENVAQNNAEFTQDTEYNQWLASQEAPPMEEPPDEGY